jgi:RNA polymerase sigma-70 factor, ECF subfamily
MDASRDRRPKKSAELCGTLADIESELKSYLSTALAAWPELPLEAAVFARHVAERSPAGRLPPTQHAADLYLACACAHRVAGAHAAFESRYSATIARAVSRKNASTAFVDEATQRVRERLFVSPHGLPKIAEYSGRAALQTWLSVAASRAALVLLRGEARRRETAIAGPDVLGTAGSPELVFLRRRYARHFAAALANAFLRLSDKDRTILQFHIVDGLTVDQLGALYKVGRSTAARWIATARTALVDGTRRELRGELGLSDSEYDGLAPLLRSEIDVSVVKLLRRA